MKAICPISGVPFRTYDSLRTHLVYPHPIFSMSFEQLVLLLEDLRVQEENELKNFDDKVLKDKQESYLMATLKDLTNETITAIHEKNWNNNAFKLYQSKQLVLLAFMHKAELLNHEQGYCARPAPNIIEAYFWRGVSIFSWVCTISNPNLHETLPRYKISRETETFVNLSEYLQVLEDIKSSHGHLYRSRSEEENIRVWQQAIAILSRRRETLKMDITGGNNKLAARWALAITRAPKDMYDFWFAILSSSSIKITFEGVELNGKYERVTEGDLRELRDFLEDELLGPSGEVKEYHTDDGEYYFIARQTVLAIIRRHITIIEQGTSSFKIINVAVGNDVLSANDDTLEQKAISFGLPTRPPFEAYIGKKIDFIRAMAKWRTETKQTVIELTEKDITENQETIEKEKEHIPYHERTKYEIL